MKMKIKILLCLLFATFLITENALGQRKGNKYRKAHQKSRKISHYKGSRLGAGKFRPYHFVGFGVNALNYYGDLAPASGAASSDISMTRPGFAFIYGYRFHPQAAARVAYNFGRLRGDDNSSAPNGESEARYNRNLSFRNNIQEFTAGIEFYLFPERSGPNRSIPINAYLFVGAGYYHHQPQGLVPDFDYQLEGPDATTKAPKAGEWVRLQPLQTEGKKYSLNEWNIPIGIGGMLKLPSNHLSIGMELGFRFTFTDYLDDVSNRYVGLDQFDETPKGRLARIMSDRATEPIAAVTGERRRGITPTQVTFPSGEQYYVNSFIGSGSEGGVRGGKGDDVYFITQVRVVYKLSQRSRSAAKFR